jgi:hypothetical protein
MEFDKNLVDCFFYNWFVLGGWSIKVIFSFILSQSLYDLTIHIKKRFPVSVLPGHVKTTLRLTSLAWIWEVKSTFTDHTIWSHLILLQLDPALFCELANFNFLARADIVTLVRLYLLFLSNAYFNAMYRIKVLLGEIAVFYLTSILFLSV